MRRAGSSPRQPLFELVATEQARVQSIAGEELGMRALLDNAPLVEHHDTVHARECGQAVGDQQHGPPSVVLERLEFFLQSWIFSINRNFYSE